MVYYTQGAKAYKKMKKQMKKEKEAEDKKTKESEAANKTLTPSLKRETDAEDEGDIFDDIEVIHSCLVEVAYHLKGEYIPSPVANQAGIVAYSSYVSKLAPVAKVAIVLSNFSANF